MDLFEAIERRRSCREYADTPVPESVIRNALDAAVLAPNSSNVQTWQFFWVRSPEKQHELIEACLGQSAARTAQELVVVAVDRKLWRPHRRLIIEHLKETRAPREALFYYEKLIPFSYGFSFLAPLKWLLANAIGLFRPMVRTSCSPWHRDEVPIKSAALGAENFMLAIAAQGYDTCPMEGMDEVRVKRILDLPGRARIVMVISVGERTPEGIWGERFRVPRDLVIREV